jgi:hypothetical protein
VSLTEAEQAVAEYLAAEPGPVTWTGPPGLSGWAATIPPGGGEGADPATVRFSKSRAFPGCQLHQVEFTNHNGHPQRLLVRTWQQADGTWVADPIGGGGGADPYRPRPWVNFAAAWSAELFAAGGTVTGNGAEAGCTGGRRSRLSGALRPAGHRTSCAVPPAPAGPHCRSCFRAENWRSRWTWRTHCCQCR